MVPIFILVLSSDINEMQMARQLIGTRTSNPILDSCSFKVAFADGATEEYTTNLIAKNMYLQKLMMKGETMRYYPRSVTTRKMEQHYRWMTR